MSIDLDFCFSVPLMILFASEFYVATDVGVFEWPIYVRAILMDTAFYKCPNKPPNFDSVRDYIPYLIIFHSTCTGPFSMGIACIGVLNFGPSKKYPPDLLCASGSEMWNASKYM